VLEKVRKALPLIGLGRSREAIQAERDQVQSDLDAVYADLDGLRAEFREVASADTSSPERYTALNRREKTLGEHKDALRKRRRELDQMLMPPSPPPLVDVPKPAELTEIEVALDEARARREKCLRETSQAVAEGKDMVAMKHSKAREEAEAEISVLRIQRRVLEEEYTIAVRTALAPLVSAAAEKLLAAVKDAEPAIELLSRAAAMSGGSLNQLDNPLRAHGFGDDVANIPFRALANFARSLGADQERG